MLALTFPSLLRKAYDRLSTRARGLPLWLRDQWRQTYVPATSVPAGALRRHLSRLTLDPQEHIATLRLADFFVQHRFDILGSGWRDWSASRLAST